MNRVARLVSLVVLMFASVATAMSDVAPGEPVMSTASRLFALLEIPFLVFCVVFAFLSARQLRGGVFGTGMTLMAWGFLVMGVGHLHMQMETHMGFNLFQTLFGPHGGQYAWFVALFATWTLSGMGFMRIYKASRGV
ncbi:MAG: hypothetical protein HOM68_01890 [Gemmatimonadetes bacterium]|jgi:hypothetical protein|nr:hypothetical protein [Gemmatimonadota bacterium]MBT5055265.1 hypothetical protein [Gemmatimonadota bacterium]MBT5142865.1 hypothetical protein [Gemmatimonadota bacterium]MBT5589458.1 hypothetical protein [Gemmatimonadota bacterium]MBT5960001.1 hypothetical protein [Gemmatimonadota bacterium]